MLQRMPHLGYICIMREKYELIIDDTQVMPKKKGNGIITRKAWVDKNKDLVKYSLAYINENITLKDSGRVLGYDNSHGFHHKHYMGKVIPVKFISLEETEKQFEKEFKEVHDEYTKT